MSAELTAAARRIRQLEAALAIQRILWLRLKQYGIVPSDVAVQININYLDRVLASSADPAFLAGIAAFSEAKWGPLER